MRKEKLGLLFPEHPPNPERRGCVPQSSAEVLETGGDSHQGDKGRKGTWAAFVVSIFFPPRPFLENVTTRWPAGESVEDKLLICD